MCIVKKKFQLLIFIFYRGLKKPETNNKRFKPRVFVFNYYLTLFNTFLPKRIFLKMKKGVRGGASCDSELNNVKKKTIDYVM